MGKESGPMRARRLKKSAVWATAVWVVFLALMCLRIWVSQSANGAAALLLNFGLIILGTLALYALIAWLVSVNRRPLRRLVEMLRQEHPDSVVVLAMGTDDFYLGVSRATHALQRYERGLKRMFVAEFSPSSVAFWDASSTPTKVAMFEREHVVGIHQESMNGPIGFRATVVLVIRTPSEEIVLPFLIIRDRGAGLLPRDQGELNEFLTDVTKTTGIPRQLPASK
jgi:hypothetical protein